MSTKVNDDYGSLKPYLIVTKGLFISSIISAVGLIVSLIILFVYIADETDIITPLILSGAFLVLVINFIVLYAIFKGLESFVRLSVFKLHEYEYEKEYEIE